MSWKLIVLASIAAITASSQTPAFDVTSVRPVKFVSGQPRKIEFGCSNGRFVSFGVGLRQALLWAYDVRFYQVENVPPWIE
jgi:uncharacterized protein (TIGR03435 family)